MTDQREKTVEILDCTIRDGGYLNNWDFDPKLVRELYGNLSRAGVDIVELGYRNPGKDGMGMWYATPEKVLDELLADARGAKVALMLDYDKADGTSLPDAADSLVTLYRVACQKDKILEALGLCEDLKAKGYQTSLQLMGIVGFSEEDFERIQKPLANSSLDYVYFADSYGSMFPKDMAGFVQRLRPSGKRIGFHAHNGLQLAFANTLEAMRCGADIVDGTVYGMGRGAGNLPVEVLITYLEKTLSHERYNAVPVLDLIDRYFREMQQALHWGYCLPYMLSGIFEVHPNYAKYMVDAHEYDMDDMVKVLETVRSCKPIGYKRRLIETVVQRGFACPEGEDAHVRQDDTEWAELKKAYPVTYAGRHDGQDFLVLANGPTLKQHQQQIRIFIDRHQPVVLGANFLGGLIVPHYHAFSNKKRFMNYADKVHEDSRLLLSSSFAEGFIRRYISRDYERIVHLDRISARFDIRDGVISSNCRTVSILLIAVAIVMGAKRIFVAGMDGYKMHDGLESGATHFYEEVEEAETLRMLVEKHNWNERLLENITMYLTGQDREGIHILTPTSHKKYYNHFQNWERAATASAGGG